MRKRKTRRMPLGRVLVAVTVLTVAVVAGCSKQKPVDQEPETNIVEDAKPAPAGPPPRAEPAPSKLPDPAANIAEALPPEKDPSPDEQMLEDADAAGLTSRTAPLGVDEAPSADPVGDLIANDGVGT